MRHALLVVLTLALGPVAMDGFRAWPAPSLVAPTAQPKAVTLAEAGGLILGGPYPPHHLEPYGLGYMICPGETAAVWTTALGSMPSK